MGGATQGQHPIGETGMDALALLPDGSLEKAAEPPQLRHCCLLAAPSVLPSACASQTSKVGAN